MEIFGIGPLELVLILLLALVILGPKEMVNMSKKAAAWLRKFRQSDTWKTTKEVMEIPNKVMEETGLDKEIRELNTLTQKTISTSIWNGESLTTPKKSAANTPAGEQSPEPENQNKTDSPHSDGGENAS
jgi:Sec-independent protein translocase protein TatA